MAEGVVPVLLPYCSSSDSVCESLSQNLQQCTFWDDPGALVSTQRALQAVVAATALLLCGFYCFQHARGFPLWTVTYYTVIVAGQYVTAAAAPRAPPLYLYTPCSAAPVNWLRYGAWLLILPALILALARVGSLSNSHSHLLEPMLITNTVTVVLGVSAAATPNLVVKAALLAGAGIVAVAALVYTAVQYFLIYSVMPFPNSKRAVLMLAALFYTFWVAYPILFLAGPEGFGNLPAAASDIAYAVADLVKLAWGVGAWYLDHMRRQYLKEYDTDLTKVKIPMGLGFAEVLTFDRSSPVPPPDMPTAALHTATATPVAVETAAAAPVAAAAAAGEADKSEPQAKPPGRKSRGKSLQKMRTTHEDAGEDVGEELVDPRTSMGQRNQASGAGSLEGKRSGSRSSRGRLSLDVKERLQEIERKSHESELRKSHDSVVAEQEAAAEEGEHRKSTESDPGPLSRMANRGRLSLDMRKRIEEIQRTSSESHDNGELDLSRPRRSSGGRLSIDRNTRVDALVRKISNETDASSVYDGGRASDASTSLSTTAVLHGEDNVTMEKLPWENTSRKHTSRSKGEAQAQDVGSTARRLNQKKAQKGRKQKGEVLEFSKMRTTVSHNGLGIDYGPSPVPKRPVRVLLATSSEDVMDQILDQIDRYSSECPLLIDGACDLIELNSIVSFIKKEDKAKEFDMAIVHSSLVSSPVSQALRQPHNIPLVAFGSRKDCGNIGEDFDSWLPTTQGYIPHTGHDPFPQMELLRMLAYWQHQRDVSNQSRIL